MFPHTYRNERSETITTNSLYGEHYRRRVDKKIHIQDSLLKLLQYVDANRNTLVKNLGDAVAIKSVAGHPKYGKEVLKMVKFAESWLNRLGVKYECFHIGNYKVDGKEYKLPPVIVGGIGNDGKKPTVGIFQVILKSDYVASD